MTILGETFFKAYAAEINAESQSESVIPSAPHFHAFKTTVQRQALERVTQRKRIMEEVLETPPAMVSPSESLFDVLTSSMSEKSRLLLQTREFSPQEQESAKHIPIWQETEMASVFPAFESLQNVNDSAEKFFQKRTQTSEEKRVSTNNLSEISDPFQNWNLITEKPVSTVEYSPSFVPVHWPKRCDQFREVASSQLHRLVRHLLRQIQLGRRRIAFCGNRSGSGCTTLLLCTARELAAHGHKTILIDAHFAKPSIASLLQLPLESGWETLLQKDAGVQGDTAWTGNDRKKTIAKFLWTIEPNLDVVPLCTSTPEPSLFTLQQVRQMLELVGRQYEMVLIDSGHFPEKQRNRLTMEKKITEIMQSTAEGILLIAGTSTNRNTNPGLTFIEECLRSCEIALIGIAENYV